MRITKEQWYQHPSFMLDLQKLLDDPVLAVALQIVEDRAKESTIVPPAGVSITEFFAIMGAKRDGAFETLKNLRSLSQPDKPRQQDPPPWATEKPAISAGNS